MAPESTIEPELEQQASGYNIQLNLGWAYAIPYAWIGEAEASTDNEEAFVPGDGEATSED